MIYPRGMVWGLWRWSVGLTAALMFCASHAAGDCTGQVATEVPPAKVIPNVYNAPQANENQGRPYAAVLVHGANSDPDAWVRDRANFDGQVNWVGMQNALIAKLAGNANQWDVWGLDWRQGAQGNNVPSVKMTTAAQLQGQFVAKHLFARAYQHVHLVGHSLGGRVIESAANLLRQLPAAPSVHTTFLDAYTPRFVWKWTFGSSATWSEHYYNTGDLLSTSEQFPFAMNGNITAFRPAQPPQGFVGNWGHSWPTFYYRETVRANAAAPPYFGYGYPLSFEAKGLANWPTPEPTGVNYVFAAQGATGNLVDQAVESNSVAVNLAAADVLCSEAPQDVSITSGVLRLNGGVLPSWANVQLTTTAEINFIEFEYRIASDFFPARLLVYVDDVLVWAADSQNRIAQFASTGLLSPGSIPAGNHVIRFRWEVNVVQLGNPIDIRNIRAGLLSVPAPPNGLPINGRRLGIKDQPAPSTRDKLVYLAKDSTLTPPVAGGADDPTVTGASFTVRNPITLESVTYTLPALADGDPGRPLWKTNAAGTVFSYKNSFAPGGPSPVKTARIKAGKLKVVVADDISPFTLDESQQQVLETVLETGSTRYCSRFDLPTKDIGSFGIASGVFSAKDRPAPTSCD